MQSIDKGLKFQIDASPPAALRLSWTEPRGLFRLSVVNFLLRIVTLGLYGFWARTEVRKRIWSAVRIDGEPLQYTGTGRELFLGFLIVFLLLLMPMLLLSIWVAVAFGPESGVFDLFQLGLYAVLFFLTGYALYRAQRYRLSRTAWRAIRASLEGEAGSYARLYFWTGVLVPLTVGWIIPWRSTRLQGRVVDNMRFGDRPFRFTARSGPLYRSFAALWVGAALILILAMLGIGGVAMEEMANFEALPDGRFQPNARAVVGIMAVVAIAYVLYMVMSAWYRARQINHFAAHTHFDAATFKSSVTGRGLMWISLSNFLIVVLSLGLLSPIAQARSARYLIQRLRIEGPVRLDAISQGTAISPQRGEGLAQAFDVDAF